MMNNKQEGTRYTINKPERKLDGKMQTNSISNFLTKYHLSVIIEIEVRSLNLYITTKMSNSFLTLQSGGSAEIY